MKIQQKKQTSKEQQLHSDSGNAKDEMSLERMAQVNSVGRILKESIEKLKISLILPQIFENPVILRQHLQASEYQICRRLIEGYVKDKKMELSGNSPYLNYRLIKIIDYFHENANILENIPNCLDDDMSDEDKSLLDAFELLQNITEERLKKSALSELTKEKKIHEIFHENETLKKNIQAIQKQIKTQNINALWKIGGKSAFIQKLEEDLSYRKYDYNVKIKQEIIKSSRSIKEIHAASAIKQKELQEELDRIQAKYDKLLKENLKQEQTARDEKNKLLIQLQTLIKKFDQTIGDKIIENMNLQEEYEKQKKQFDEFMIDYKRDENEYIGVVRAKEDEEKRLQEQKLLLFMMNRAARTIQKRWRRFRRAQRKQAKKGKGKKGKKK